MSELLSGRAFLEDIDLWVDRWHDSDSDVQLWDFLGMSEREYGLWVERPDALPFIVAAHEQEKPVEELLDAYSDRELVAARADDAEQAREVTAWLRRTGRLT